MAEETEKEEKKKKKEGKDGEVTIADLPGIL